MSDYLFAGAVLGFILAALVMWGVSIGLTAIGHWVMFEVVKFADFLGEVL